RRALFANAGARTGEGAVRDHAEGRERRRKPSETAPRLELDAEQGSALRVSIGEGALVAAAEDHGLDRILEILQEEAHREHLRRRREVLEACVEVGDAGQLEVRIARR